MLNTFLWDVEQPTLRAGKWVRSLLCFIALFTGASAGHAASPPTLVLNDTNEPPYTTAAGDGFLDVIAGEAFRRAGLQLSLVKLPPERGLINANAGVDDGDLTRIAGLEKNYPNLVRVSEKLIDWHFAAFSRLPGLQPVSWAVLEPLTVGHIKGWKIYEQNLRPGSLITTADSPEQLFTMMDKSRIEVALYERWLGGALAKKLDIQVIRALEPPLAVREMFIYLNRRHAEKVPEIAAALRAIKVEGTYTRVCLEKLGPLGAPASQCEAK